MMRRPCIEQFLLHSALFDSRDDASTCVVMTHRNADRRGGRGARRRLLRQRPDSHRRRSGLEAIIEEAGTFCPALPCTKVETPRVFRRLFLWTGCAPPATQRFWPTWPPVRSPGSRVRSSGSCVLSGRHSGAQRLKWHTRPEKFAPLISNRHESALKALTGIAILNIILK
jgi:hypothetical protein